jgi:hypothetical protein
LAEGGADDLVVLKREEGDEYRKDGGLYRLKLTVRLEAK